MQYKHMFEVTGSPFSYNFTNILEPLLIVLHSSFLTYSSLIAYLRSDSFSKKEVAENPSISKLFSLAYLYIVFKAFSASISSPSILYKNSPFAIRNPAFLDEDNPILILFLTTFIRSSFF